eukprot:m.15852 g.15852  ORF g.15852 m.15852 type:complete len:581 (+) comp5510_c0_seq2:25-1767(+)
MAEQPLITREEVAKHNTPESCWVIIQDYVYDMTKFFPEHPGGWKVLMVYAGKDASTEFAMLHRPGILEKFGTNLRVGRLAGTEKKVGSINAKEVIKHKSKESCWSVIHGKVYDLTSFLGDHPGGANIILKYAGMDASNAYDAAGHPKDLVEQLGLTDQLLLGDLAPGDEHLLQPPKPSVSKSVAPVAGEIPPLSQMLSLFDFERIARSRLSDQAWAYYSSGSDDEVTMRENRNAFQRIWFRPKILVDVHEIDLSSKILGYACSVPIYITATALGRLAHPDGEIVLTRAAKEQDVIQMCPTLASCTLDEMTTAARGNQIQFFQLYVNKDKKVTEKLIEKAKAGGVKAICVTVDAPQLGRREKDMRMKFTLEGTHVQKTDDDQGKVDRSQGTARAISQFIDPGLSWKDIPWLKRICHPMKVLLKGVQCKEDALKAVEYGLDGVICSNHGGRQLDYARSGIEVLEEVMDGLRAHGLQNKLEVLVDGGVRRGTDVLKALAMGATGVGLGRPFLYAMAGYGQPGAERVIQILKDELVMGMRLLGCQRISDIQRSMVVTKNLQTHTTSVPDDSGHNLYQPILKSNL